MVFVPSRRRFLPTLLIFIEEARIGIIKMLSNKDGGPLAHFFIAFLQATVTGFWDGEAG